MVQEEDISALLRIKKRKRNKTTNIGRWQTFTEERKDDAIEEIKLYMKMNQLSLPNSILTLLQRIVDQRNINIRDRHGDPILYNLVNNSSSELIELLLQNGADPNITTDNKETPLHRIAWSSNPDAEKIAELLLAYGADPNATTVSRTTPLHWAVSQSKLGIAELLLNHKADPNITNQDGKTPLHMAVSEQDIEAVRLLLEHNANPFIEDNEQKLPYDYTTNKELQEILRKKMVEIIEGIIDYTESNEDVGTILKHGPRILGISKEEFEKKVEENYKNATKDMSKVSKDQILNLLNIGLANCYGDAVKNVMRAFLN